MSRIEDKLHRMGLSLPEPPAAGGAYAPFVISGTQVFISGQIPFRDGVVIRGQVGQSITEAEAADAAKLCALNLLALLKAACGGNLDRAKRCIKLGGFVQAAPDFHAHPGVLNGASDLINDVMGGRHARFAVGVSSLPANAAVEVEGLFEIEPECPE